MNEKQPMEDLQHIKLMMERSSRFISLSGLSGIAAGICALAGAWMASVKIHCWVNGDCQLSRLINNAGSGLLNELFWIAAMTFLAAFVLARLPLQVHLSYDYQYAPLPKDSVFCAMLTPHLTEKTKLLLAWSFRLPLRVCGQRLCHLMRALSRPPHAPT